MEQLNIVHWLRNVIKAKAQSMPALSSICVTRWIADMDDKQLRKLILFSSKYTDSAEPVQYTFEGVWRPLLRFYENKIITSTYEHGLIQVEAAASAENSAISAANDRKTGFCELPRWQSYHGLYPRQSYHGLYKCGRVYGKITSRRDLSYHDVDTAKAPVQERVVRLNYLAPAKSPLDTLSELLSTLILGDSDITAFLLEHFRATVGSIGDVSPGSKITINLKNIKESDGHHQDAHKHHWTLCDITSMIILAFCAPSYRLAEFIKEPTLGEDNPLLIGSPWGRVPFGFVPSATLRGA